MATSVLLPVMLTLPWLKFCAMLETVVPMPGVLAMLPEPMAEATRSANSAVEDFMPTVLALAMLLPMTSRFWLAAVRPESPVW